MLERRKSPRYRVYFRVYYPANNSWGHCTDISLEGCRLWVPFLVAPGHLVEFLLELPVIGVIQLTGYVQHMQDSNEVGVQLVQVRFSREDTIYYQIYAKFLKVVAQLKEVKENYEALVEQGEIPRYILPNEQDCMREARVG